MPTTAESCTELSDEELVDRIATGETQALAELYERYSRSLCVFCRHLTRRDAAVDLVHECFLRVVRAARSFEPGKASLRTWLFRIARNLCIDWRRDHAGQRGMPLDPGESDAGVPVVDGRSQVEGAAIHSEVIRAVRDCITTLGQRPVREALLLYHMGGKVYREIGEILGRSTSMARNLVKAAQERVRRCLAEKGIDSPSVEA